MDRSLENKINLEEILPGTLLEPVFRKQRYLEILSRLIRGTVTKLQNILFIGMKKNVKCAVRAFKHVQKAFTFLKKVINYLPVSKVINATDSFAKKLKIFALQNARTAHYD